MTNLRFRFCSITIATILVLTVTTCAQTAKTKMPKEELDALMNSVLAFAQQMLSVHGEFFPFGGVMTTKGEIISIGASDGGENPPSQRLIDLMTESFQAKAKSGEYRATAIVFDVRVTVPSTGKKSDAVEIRLDHVDRMSIEVLFPYEIDSKGKIIYGEMFAQKGASIIFTKSKGGH